MSCAKILVQNQSVACLGLKYIGKSGMSGPIAVLGFVLERARFYSSFVKDTHFPKN